MAFIPEDAKWYIGQIVLKLSIEDEPRSVVHVNYLLIRANSPEEAFEKAILLGKESETEYENPFGKLVQTRFWGLRQLNVIHDELEHGGELMYDEEVGLSDEEIRMQISEKSQLAVFLPITPKEGPNYMSKDILIEMNKMLAEKHSGGATQE